MREVRTMTDQSNYPPPPVQPTAPFEPGYPPAAPPARHR